MPKVLLVDDDPHLRKILAQVLTKNDFDVVIAEDGATGLRAAKRQKPDLIILDIIMPGMDGFEVAQRLHDDPASARIPIMVLTAYATPYGRKAAVEVGVDDFVTKPFGIDDIVAKVKTMTTSRPLAGNRSTEPLKPIGQAQVICVHTLRGGLGATSLAVNLATALNYLWQRPTLLVDAEFAKGQVALALNRPGTLNWSDLIQASLENSLQRLIDKRLSAGGDGLHVLTAPRDPKDADRISARVLTHALRILEQPYDYVVADLAHDLRENTFELLKNANKILHLAATDNVSLQLAKNALAAYRTKGIQPEDVLLVLVDTRPGRPIDVQQVELAAGKSLAAYIPYAAGMATAAARYEPFVDAFPDHRLTQFLEDLAYFLSREEHRNAGLFAPTPAYNRVYARAAAAANNGAANDIGGYMLKQAGIDR